MKIKKLRIFLFLFSLSLVTSCDVLQQVTEMKMLSKCEFRIGSVTDIRLVGINFSRVQSLSDISTLDMIRLTTAVLSNNLPLDMKINLEVNNPNDQAASLNRLDWMLFIDDLQMIEGAVDERFYVAQGEIGTLPINITFNLAEALRGDKAEKIIDFATGLSNGSSQGNRVMLRLKPSVMVGQRTVIYPGYIDVKNIFTVR